MLNASQVNNMPHNSVFQRNHADVVSRTQVKPNAFRVNYFADGTGRDTFVKNDNGGFFKEFQPVPAYPVTAFRARRSYAPPAPIIKSRGVYYHSDGSGRDSYVCVNAGGLTGLGKVQDYRDTFKSSLRVIDRPQTAYVKKGQSDSGMRRTATVTLLPRK